MTKPLAVTFTVAGERFTKTPGQVERACRDIEPDPVLVHAVQIKGRTFPPKQVLSAVTGLDRLAFPTTEAIRVLRRLGFKTERR